MIIKISLMLTMARRSPAQRGQEFPCSYGYATITQEILRVGPLFFQESKQLNQLGGFLIPAFPHWRQLKNFQCGAGYLQNREDLRTSFPHAFCGKPNAFSALMCPGGNNIRLSSSTCFIAHYALPHCKASQRSSIELSCQ
jgi:hypothetical protein